MQDKIVLVNAECICFDFPILYIYNCIKQTTLKDIFMKKTLVGIFLLTNFWCFISCSDVQNFELKIINNLKDELEVVIADSASPFRRLRWTVPTGTYKTKLGVTDLNKPYLQYISVSQCVSMAAKLWSLAHGYVKEIIYEENLVELPTTFSTYGPLIIEISKDNTGKIFTRRYWEKTADLFQKTNAHYAKEYINLETYEKGQETPDHRPIRFFDENLAEQYEILGLKQGSTEQEIKKAYRKLVLEWHPDKHENKAMAQQMMQKINQAYEALLAFRNQ